MKTKNLNLVYYSLLTVVIAFISSLIIMIASKCSVYNEQNYILRAILESVIFAAWTIFLLKKNNCDDKLSICSIILAVLFGRFVLMHPFYMNHPISLVTMDMVHVTVFLSVLLTGLCYYKRKVSLYVISALIVILFATWGQNWWTNYLENIYPSLFNK
ncbi:MAG: hypothetical protein IJ624_01295 [Prevotella sp.]|nr:hypothetical protein [Prevotella sp.]